MDFESSVAVPVVGMHRSGTSLVSQMLEAGGICFGPSEELAGPNSDNPHGFWEHYGLRKINEELLERLGGTWRNPPQGEALDFSDSEWDDLRSRAQDLLVHLSKSSPCWGWKDPRTSLLLAFWLPLLPRAPRPFLCLRHPADVASSLASRNKISPGLAGYLWQEYLAAACAGLQEFCPLVLSYENILRDPMHEAKRCARFMEQSGIELDCSAMAAVVDASLAHHQEANPKFTGWWPGGEKAFEHLNLCAAGEASLSTELVVPPMPAASFLELMAEASDLFAALDFRENAYQDRVQEARAAMEEKDAALATLSALSKIQEQAKQKDARIQELSIKLEECRQDIDNLWKRSEVRLGQSIRSAFRKQPNSQ